MVSGNDTGGQNEDKSLCPVDQQKSVVALLRLLKEVFGNVKKVPGGKDNVREICDRILALHQTVIEENSELLRNKNKHLQKIVELQTELQEIRQSSPIIQNHARSYASVAKGPESHCLVFEPMNTTLKNQDGRNRSQRNQNTEHVTKEISQVLKGDNIKFAAKKIVPGRGGKYILEMQSKNDLDEALMVLTEKSEQLQFKPKPVTKRLPRMVAKEIPGYVTREECMSCVMDSNPSVKDLVAKGETFKVISVVERGTRKNVIIEVSPVLRKEIISNRGLKFGFLMVECEDHINIIRCTKCCLYGHKRSVCKGDVACSWCMGNHAYEDCEKPFTSRPVCRSCNKKNVKCEPHASYEFKKCPIAREIMDRLKKNIQYN